MGEFSRAQQDFDLNVACSHRITYFLYYSEGCYLRNFSFGCVELKLLLFVSLINPNSNLLWI